MSKSRSMSSSEPAARHAVLTPTRVGLAACVLALALALVSGARGDVVGAALTLGLRSRSRTAQPSS